MRLTTVLAKLIALPGIRVIGAELTPAGLVVDVRLRARRPRCPACGRSSRQIHDRRPPRRWRHLDVGGWRCFLRMPVRRLRCPRHGVRTEAVPFAAPHAGHTRAFEDLVAWLAQRADKTAITHLLRISSRGVGRILLRYMARVRPAGDPLEGLCRIGVDEKSYRRGHRYLTLVVDHARRGRVVWMAEGRSEATLDAFFDALGPERAAQLEAVSLDLLRSYVEAVRRRAPQATVCFDPFHVVRLADFALDEVRREEWNRARRSRAARARAIKRTRWALLKHPARLSAEQRETLALVRRRNRRLWRAYELKEMLRAIYHTGGLVDAAAWLKAAIVAGLRSRLAPFVQLAETLRQHRAGILRSSSASRTAGSRDSTAGSSS